MIKTLSKYSCPALIPQATRSFLSTFPYVFNPSIIDGNGGVYMAIRVFNEDTGGIESLLFFWDSSESFQWMNLTNYFKEEIAIDKVADPKLFKLEDGSICGTFNTGYTERVSNSIFFFELDKTYVKSYYRCAYNKRERIEKNWAFYSHNNELCVLYSINPLRILKCSKSEKILECEEIHVSSLNTSFGNLSLGTPLLSVSEDEFIFIAHKKYFHKKKRLYTGKPMVFNAQNNTIATQSSQVIHSLSSLRGTEKKFNRNLISCTYFSGIMKMRENIIVTYGINDIAWNLVQLKYNALWKR
jgi:hypothetical protein